MNALIGAVSTVIVFGFLLAWHKEAPRSFWFVMLTLVVGGFYWLVHQ